jgi:hypothetical protein
MYSPVNHSIRYMIRYAAHRIEIISTVSLDIENEKMKKGVNNEIPGAFRMIQPDFNAHVQILQW